jgi:hypothetical protein
MMINLVAFGYAPVDAPEKKVIEPPYPPEPNTIYVEGPITRIRKGTSTLNNVEKAAKLINHILEIGHDGLEGFNSNHASLWFTSPVIGRVQLELLGVSQVEEIGNYQEFILRYQDKNGVTKKLKHSFNEIDDETFLLIQKYLDRLQD